MFISVIVCTYRRAADLAVLLPTLAAQTYPDMEVLVVDGSGDDPAVRETVEGFLDAHGRPLNMRLLVSRKGLMRQRNVALKEARGEVICFLDDDVTVDETFVAEVAGVFQRPDTQDVGGICGYDTAGYPSRVSLRWRLRQWLGTVPSLEPGAADRLGRTAPLSFAMPSPAWREVGWLSGFCMIYRRAAIGDLRFDEEMLTQGEDKDFSLRVGASWRLLLCGGLRVQHHPSAVERVSATRRLYQSGHGTGRIFAKRATRGVDYLTISRSLLGEFVIDILAFVTRPSRESLFAPFARAWGMIAGFRSLNKRPTRAQAAGRSAPVPVRMSQGMVEQ